MRIYLRHLMLGVICRFDIHYKVAKCLLHLYLFSYATHYLSCHDKHLRVFRSDFDLCLFKSFTSDQDLPCLG